MFLNQARAQRLMREQNLDAIIGSTLENVYYLSGVWSESFIVTPRAAQLFAVAVADRLDTPFLVAGLSDPATILQSAPNAAGIFLYGNFFRMINPEASLSDLELESSA
jgi:Xaa-Pro aminopeptidase